MFSYFWYLLCDLPHWVIDKESLNWNVQLYASFSHLVYVFDKFEISTFWLDISVFIMECFITTRFSLLERIYFSYIWYQLFLNSFCQTFHRLEYARFFSLQFMHFMFVLHLIDLYYCFLDTPGLYFICLYVATLAVLAS